MTATVSPIESIRVNHWPATRAARRAAERERADAWPRTIVCGHCFDCSPPLNGVEGRAWWAAHKCRPLRLVAS